MLRASILFLLLCSSLPANDVSWLRLTSVAPADTSWMRVESLPDSMPFADSPIAEPEPSPAADHGHIVIITADWCVPCRQIKPVLDAGLAAVRKSSGLTVGRTRDSQVQVLDADLDVTEIEALQLDDVDLPFLAFIRGKEIVRQWQHGCESPPDQWTIRWLWSAVDRRPVPPRQAVRAGGYPLRGGLWNVDGGWPGREGLIAHLLSGQHRGKFDRGWLNTLSLSQAHALHSSDHEGRVDWRYAKRPGQWHPVATVLARAAPPVRTQNTCPHCPGYRR